MSVSVLVITAFGVGTAVAVALGAVRFASGDLDAACVLVVQILAADYFRPLVDL